MKLRLTVVYEYSTGANDEETLNSYGTTDPQECAAIDAENDPLLILALADQTGEEITYKVEVVE